MRKRNLKLYHINGDYVNYLKSFDSHVQHNYDSERNQKPYVGIVLSVNGKHYFAPLTSPKEKHLKIKNSDPTTFKIKDNTKFYGSVLLNNMIPVKTCHLIAFDISEIKDLNYKNLLNREYQIISKNETLIRAKANTLYNSVISKSNAYFCKVSCDFQQLEIACDHYSE
ncbi:hypothetical protein A4G20_02410 [Pasteurellaceae bacterium RH1A]|nr:hypothetical protein A4G20_02410 [Pasteurellaceae bacterium RH1A]